jgi:hypothetical protein
LRGEIDYPVPPVISAAKGLGGKNVATAIPVPLRSGEYTLSHGTYTGDVGGHDQQNPPTLNIKNHSTVNATVAGIGDPATPENSQPYYATFNVQGVDTLNLTEIGRGIRTPFGGGIVTVNLAPHAKLTTSFDASDTGSLTVNGDDSAQLRNLSATDNGAATIHANIVGTGTVTVHGLEPGAQGNLTLDGAVGRGETIALGAGNLTLDQSMRFLGSINWEASPSAPNDALFAGTTADSYTYDGTKLHLFADNKDFLDIRVTNSSNAPFYVVQTTSGAGLTSINPAFDPNVGTALPLHTA